MPSVASAGYLASVLITTPSTLVLADDTMNNPSADKQTFVESVAARRYWDTTVAPVIQVELDAVQTVALTGSPTGGTFTLTFGGNTTTGIAYNANAATVQAALQALASIGANNALVTGGPGPSTAWVVEFAASLGFSARTTMTFSGASLTGGSSPNVTVAVTQVGQAWTTASAATYTIQWVNATVKFNSPFLGANIGVRAHSANYFAYATLGFCKSWELVWGVDSLETSVMVGAGGSPAKLYIPGMFGGTAKLDKFWIDGTFLPYVTAGTLLVLSLVTPTNNRYEAYVFAKDSNIKANLKATVDDSLTFQITGPLTVV